MLLKRMVRFNHFVAPSDVLKPWWWSGGVFNCQMQ
jgi:hypothetical protein